MGSRMSGYSDNTSVDTGWAWMVLLGANLWNLTVAGTLKSFGVLYVEFIALFDSRPTETGWIGFVFCMMMLLLSPFAGYLGDKVSPRWIMILGGLVASGGVFFTGFVPSLNWAIVSYGLIAGGAVGIMDGPVFSTLNKYFQKRRALANSLAFTGSGVGCLLVPLLIRTSVQYYSLRGTMFILGGLWLHSLVIGALFRPIRLDDADLNVAVISTENHPNINGGLLEQQNTDMSSPPHGNIKDEILVLNNTCKKGPDYCDNETAFSEVEESSKDHCASLVLNSQENGTKVNNLPNGQITELDCLKPIKPKSKWHLVQFTLKDYWMFLKNAAMLRIVLAIMFGGIAYFSQIFLLPPLSEELGISRLRGAFLVSLVGIAETISRIPLGFICDKPFMNKPLLVSVLSIVSCTLGMVLSFVPLWGVLVAYACLIGILGGTILPLAMPMLSDVVPTARIGAAAGLFLWAMGMAYAVGPPVLGAVKEYSGSYMHSFRLCVLMYIPTAFFLLWGVISHRCHMTKSPDPTKDTSS